MPPPTIHNAYKPNQRRVRVDVMTVPGWVNGTMHVAIKSPLVVALNKECAFVPMTDVTTEAEDASLPFLAIRRSAILLVVPDPDDVERHPHGQPGTFESKSLRCHLASGIVEGKVAVLGGLRVSDYLETNPGFMLLSHCTVTSDGRPGEERFRHVIVNASHVLAVTEMGRSEENELVGATGSHRAQR